MTTNAWIFLGVSWAIIVASTVVCFAKLLTSKQQFGERSEE
jgi:hypothetical protein